MTDKKTEALKLALAFIEDTAKYLPHVYDAPGLSVHTAIREALAEQPEPQSHCNDCGGFDPDCPLAQPAQQKEPIAWMYPDDHERMLTSETFCTVYSVEVGSPTRGETTIALYTSPPTSKPWVGLTEDEINEVLGGDIRDEPSGELEFVRAIEAKLKEKNA